MGESPFSVIDISKRFPEMGDTTVVLDFVNFAGKRSLKEALSDVLVIRDAINQIRIELDSMWLTQSQDDYFEVTLRAIMFGCSLEVNTPTRLPMVFA